VRCQGCVDRQIQCSRQWALNLARKFAADSGKKLANDGRPSAKKNKAGPSAAPSTGDDGLGEGGSARPIRKGKGRAVPLISASASGRSSEAVESMVVLGGFDAAREAVIKAAPSSESKVEIIKYFEEASTYFGRLKKQADAVLERLNNELPK
jgi:hypothetical protein